MRCPRAEKEGVWQPALRGQVERRSSLHGRRKAGVGGWGGACDAETGEEGA